MEKTAKYFGLFLMVVLAGWGLSGCAAYDQCYDEEDCTCGVCVDGQCIDESDECNVIIEDDGGTTGDDGSSGGDESSADGGSSGDDGSGSGDDHCACANPLDGLQDDVCVRQSYTCNALNVCEAGYRCFEYDGTCRCEDDRVCGVACTQDSCCPEGKICDPLLGICHLPIACLSDLSCGEGLRCTNTFFLAEWVCQPPGQAGVGQPCQSGEDCASCVCSDLHNGVCLKRCRSNADCEDGLVCRGGETQGTWDMGCQSPYEFCECDGDDAYCFRGDCYSNYCDTGADCPNGDCVKEFGLLNPVRACSPGNRCESNEVLFDFIMDFYCITHTPCWTDADCEAPYRCLTGEELSEDAYDMEVGVCGRDAT